MRTFITDGPGDQARHFLLPAAPRLPEARTLIDQGAYFVVRAPARTGKTTTLRALAAELTAEGRYAALVCPAAISAPAADDLARVQDALLSSIRISAEEDLPPELRPPAFPPSADMTLVWEALRAWARVCPRPIVLFFEEIDTLHGAAFQSILRQLEAGFSRRPAHFPWSIVLSGQFDLREHARTKQSESLRTIGTGPFNPSASSASLRSLTADEIRGLYAQYTAESGRPVEADAVELVHEITAGNPFYVQAIGREASALRPSSSITKDHVLEAYRRLVDKEITPIDSLDARLSEPRVRNVLEPLLAGTAKIASAPEDDVQFVRDLGLVVNDDPVRIEGWLHKALIVRFLAKGVKRAVTESAAPFFRGDGALDIEALLHGFAVFYAAHGKQLVPTIAYGNVAPSIVFLAFLLHVLEGRGWVEIDYGSSRGRIDVTISIPEKGQREVLVLVSRRKKESGAKTRGLAWLQNALEANSVESGTLVVFDQRDKQGLGKRIKLKQTSTATGRAVRLLRA